MPLPVPNILRALAAALVAGLVAPAPARPADGCSPDTAARALPPSTAASAAAGPAPSPASSPSARPAAHGVAPTAARPSRPQPTCRPAPAEDSDDDLVAAWQRISAAQDPAAMRRAARR